MSNDNSNLINRIDNLVNDADFIREAKNILKEKNANITEENVKEIIKNISDSMKKGKLNDTNLDNIVGGNFNMFSENKKYIRKFIIDICSKIAFCGGAFSGVCLGMKAGEVISYYVDENKLTDTEKARTEGVLCGAGATSGAVGGYLLGRKFGKFICDKLGLNDENKN